MVFPTSATKQDASATYQSEPIMDLTFPNPVDNVPLGDDLFNDSDIVRSLFENPIMDDVRSPTQLDHPQGSPSLLPAMNSIGIDSGIKNSSGLPENVLPVDAENVLQQPLALGYFVSTAKAGTSPSGFGRPVRRLKQTVPSSSRLPCMLIMALCNRLQMIFIKSLTPTRWILQNHGCAK
ncbi:putative mediator of RNA polymerase II transcription subunit 13, partial [Apostichopus japonicus]